MNLPLIIVVTAALLMLVIVVQALQGRQKKLEAQQARIRSLGFQPREEVPPQLQDRVDRLRRHNLERRLQLRKIYQHHGFHQDFYLVDVEERGDQPGRWMGPETMVVISSQLALPRFTLMTLPDAGAGRAVDSLADRMLSQIFQWAAQALGLQRIEFPERPDFHRRFGVLGRNEGAVRNFFTLEIMDYLTQIDLPIAIEAEGDFLAVSLTYADDRQRQDHLQDLYRITRDLTRVFTSGI
mgnify:FL=1